MPVTNQPRQHQYDHSDMPKASPESVAEAIFDGVEKGEEDIFPDPISESLAESWRAVNGGEAFDARTQRSSRLQAPRGMSKRRETR